MTEDLQRLSPSKSITMSEGSAEPVVANSNNASHDNPDTVMMSPEVVMAKHTGSDLDRYLFLCSCVDY